MKKQDYPSTLQQNSGFETEPNTPVTSAKYQYKETRELVQLVKEAADLLHVKGEAAFNDFRITGSRWRKGEDYIFVLDTEGNMIVHPDTELEGRNQLELKDINGKPIIRGLLGAASFPGKPEGWYHYEWNVPGGLLPRWKSSYVQLVKSPSGKSYIVGSGMYNDRMEREFVVDMVTNAVAEIEKRGRNAFELFRDPTGPFRVKDAYIFIMDTNGIELFNPVFTNLEGRNLMDMKDAMGKFVDREIISVQSNGSGWVDHMWPKPGESVPTQVSTYVKAANLDGKPIIVGSGVYLADAPKAIPTKKKKTAPDLMAFVREAAHVLEEQGEKAYPEFRKKGSKWFSDDTYLFVFTLDGTRVFHAAEPETEGRNDRQLKDILGRPFIQMIMDAGNSLSGEGWVHYMWPEPGDIFPAWKSSFVKRVTYHSGRQYIVGSGVYNMEMDKEFIEDVVNHAATLVKEEGRKAFDLLRDRKGPFVFMDTYVFVDSPDGVELVNPAQPSLEGKNLLELKDLQGNPLAQLEIDAAMTKGMAWLEGYWYKPGDNIPALKQTFVRKVQSGKETYIVGSGFYVNDKKKRKSERLEAEIRK